MFYNYSPMKPIVTKGNKRIFSGMPRHPGKPPQYPINSSPPSSFYIIFKICPKNLPLSDFLFGLG